VENRRPKFFIGLESRDLFPEQAEVYEMDWNKPIKTLLKGK
jgi:hypothetical protein